MNKEELIDELSRFLMEGIFTYQKEEDFDAPLT